MSPYLLANNLPDASLSLHPDVFHEALHDNSPVYLNRFMNKFDSTFLQDASVLADDENTPPICEGLNQTAQHSHLHKYPRLGLAGDTHCIFSLAAERAEGAIRATLFNVLTPKLTNAVTKWNVPDPNQIAKQAVYLPGADGDLSRPMEAFFCSPLLCSVQFMPVGGL